MPGEVIPIYFECTEKSIQDKDDSEDDRILFRNKMLVTGFKNNGCTECQIQYNHYYSEDPADNPGD